jgi:hypothetical protein
MAIQIGGSTIIDNSRNIVDAVAIGGTSLNVSAASTINNVQFIPAVGGGATVGATSGIVTYYGDGSELTNVSGTGGGIGSAINYPSGDTSPFSYINPSVTVTQDLTMDSTNAGVNTAWVVVVEPDLIIESGIGVTVGGDRKLVIDVLNITQFE